MPSPCGPRWARDRRREARDVRKDRNLRPRRGTRGSGPVRVLLGVCLALGAASGARAIVVNEPGYAVKKMWLSDDLGIPTQLGALHFSAEGSVLYVVGNAGSGTGSVYAVPVIRDSTSNAVTDLGPSTAVTEA